MTALPGGVYAITDRRQAQEPLEDIVRAALQAGFAGVMLREKDLPGGPLHEIAHRLVRLSWEFDRPLLVNDRLDVALSFPGVGAHVGARGIPVREARRLLGPDRILGYSAHEVSEAQEALREGADYVTLSPVFSSASKPDLRPRGLALIEEATRVLPPQRVFGLGGIDASNISAVRRAGAGGAFVMGAVMRGPSPDQMSREIVAAWRDASTRM